MNRFPEHGNKFDVARGKLLGKLGSKAGCTEVAIKNVYGEYAMNILRDRFDTVEAPAKKKEVKKKETTAPEGKRRRRDPRPPTYYRLKEHEDLPVREDFIKALEAKYATNVDSLIDDAFNEIDELAEEVRECHSNLESGNLGHTERAQAFETAADTLEGVDRPDVPEGADILTTVDYPDTSNRTGRAHRLSLAKDKLETAKGLLEERVSELEDGEGEEGHEDNEEKIEELQGLIDELDNVISELDGVEFPGMYG